MERLPELPKGAERALRTYDREVRKVMRKPQNLPELTHSELGTLVDDLTEHARKFVAVLWTLRADLPFAMRTMLRSRPSDVSAIRGVAGETWQMRFQPQDLEG